MLLLVFLRKAKQNRKKQQLRNHLCFSPQPTDKQLCASLQYRRIRFKFLIFPNQGDFSLGLSTFFVIKGLQGVDTPPN